MRPPTKVWCVERRYSPALGKAFEDRMQTNPNCSWRSYGLCRREVRRCLGDRLSCLINSPAGTSSPLQRIRLSGPEAGTSDHVAQGIPQQPVEPDFVTAAKDQARQHFHNEGIKLEWLDKHAAVSG